MFHIRGNNHRSFPYIVGSIWLCVQCTKRNEVIQALILQRANEYIVHYSVHMYCTTYLRLCKRPFYKPPNARLSFLLCYFIDRINPTQVYKGDKFEISTI